MPLVFLMGLSSLQLDAFLALARAGSFTRAAARLCITQSALSQRMQQLEEGLGTTLFIREGKNLRLSQSGEQMLQYCLSRERLETELLQRIAGSTTGSGGAVRVAAFSSVARSLVLPALGEVQRVHAGLQVALLVREVREMLRLLRSGEADFVLTDSQVQYANVTCELLGWEEYVLIESVVAKGDLPYLDHDNEDALTQRFLSTVRGAPPLRQRHFLADIYGIIDGVSQGLGRAVVPRHLLKNVRGVRVIRAGKAMHMPVFLSYFSPAFESQVLETTRQVLRKSCGQYLSQRRAGTTKGRVE